MKIIDLNKIREGLPNRTKVILGKKKSTPYLEIKINPSLSEEDFEMCKDWQREIIGKENISEFYTEDTGRHWLIFLKRIPLEFINVSNENINNYSNMELVKDSKLIRK